ncbi:hypothetical protein [Lewinella sp. IMCC34183]|uniref:hypothetical protein n=1 Tax=Lewinella sp. IMCC34183 TaxID=2248762 RepID=UPI0013001B62|nr:hypothetical protein [Lewinella sp. IMCC34183]
MTDLTISTQLTTYGGGAVEDLKSGYEIGNAAGHWVGEKIVELIAVGNWLGKMFSGN